MLGTLLGAIAAIAIGDPVHAQTVVDTYFNDKTTPLSVADIQLKPVKKRPESLGIKTSAQAVFVADLATGNVLYAKDPHKVMPIASLTKLVTAMVFLDLKPDLNKTLVFQPEDFDGESKPVFKPGEEITYRDALRSMLVGSVNACAKALARTTLGEKKFVAAMNDKARALHLNTPIFVEPSGINPRNQSSAADVAALISSAVAYPEVKANAQFSEVTVKGKSGQSYLIKTTNNLLGSFLNKKPYTITAAKTGSLPEAGYCMAQITRNERGNQVVAVELGSENHFSRYQDIKALTSWAFDAYEWR
ncbi:MAG: serine hydrolase [Patescibacteria group bacterium]